MSNYSGCKQDEDVPNSHFGKKNPKQKITTYKAYKESTEEKPRVLDSHLKNAKPCRNRQNISLRKIRSRKRFGKRRAQQKWKHRFKKNNAARKFEVPKRKETYVVKPCIRRNKNKIQQRYLEFQKKGISKKSEHFVHEIKHGSKKSSSQNGVNIVPKKYRVPKKCRVKSKIWTQKRGTHFCRSKLVQEKSGFPPKKWHYFVQRIAKNIWVPKTNGTYTC